MFDYIIYTDGGYSASDNVGAAAYIILSASGGNLVKKDTFVLRNETSQRAEIKAILAAMDALPDGSKAQVITDYLYAAIGLGRLPRRKNQPDSDLLVLYRQLRKQKHLRIEFKWVRSHFGDCWNELCDSLCTEALTQIEDQII
ncbi:MAG: hypothetical protein J5737_04080 [Bacteroidales bacterium]|nr:hypothetical protein [Bacteroidales bacterium]